jgi:nucleotide-binding universal stress UspA family protein
MTVRKILCPIDFSPASDAALRWGADLARQVKGEVDVIHSWQLSAYAEPTSELAKESKRQLTESVAAAIARCQLEKLVVRTHLRLGPPEEEIIKCVAELGSDLIVMATSGRTGIQHFLIGSVAERVMRSAPVPVVTVRLKQS